MFFLLFYTSWQLLLPDFIDVLHKMQKKRVKNFRLDSLQVVPPGIEPGTHGFSVRCSTN